MHRDPHPFAPQGRQLLPGGIGKTVDQPDRRLDLLPLFQLCVGGDALHLDIADRGREDEVHMGGSVAPDEDACQDQKGQKQANVRPDQAALYGLFSFHGAGL